MFWFLVFEFEGWSKILVPSPMGVQGWLTCGGGWGFGSGGFRICLACCCICWMLMLGTLGLVRGLWVGDGTGGKICLEYGLLNFDCD